MVDDHYPYFLWLFHWEYTPFSDIPIRQMMGICRSILEPQTSIGIHSQLENPKREPCMINRRATCMIWTGNSVETVLPTTSMSISDRNRFPQVEIPNSGGPSANATIIVEVRSVDLMDLGEMNHHMSDQKFWICWTVLTNVPLNYL